MNTPDPDRQPETPGLPHRRPLFATSAVLYGTLALLVLTIPRGLVNWAKNFEPNAPQQVLLQTAETIAAASHRIGADRAFAAARAYFLRVTGKGED